MKGRGLVVVLALILATLATAGVFMYARGVQEEAKTGGDMVSVIVSKVDIPANSDLNELIKDGDFRFIEIPKTAEVGDAITSVDQLQDKRNSVAILAGEQIPVARIAGTVPGGALQIPNGMEAVTVALDSSRGVAGVVSAGDQVVVYATFKGVADTSRHATTGAQPAVTQSAETVVLVPAARVLAVYRPLPGSTFGGDQAQQGASQLPESIHVTLALNPDDAQRFVFSQENGTMWFGLLPPGANGNSMKPISYAQVLK
jgi:pilus assembly protein CpaB